MQCSILQNFRWRASCLMGVGSARNLMWSENLKIWCHYTMRLSAAIRLFDVQLCIVWKDWNLGRESTNQSNKFPQSPPPFNLHDSAACTDDLYSLKLQRGRVAMSIVQCSWFYSHPGMKHQHTTIKTREGSKFGQRVRWADILDNNNVEI